MLLLLTSCNSGTSTSGEAGNQDAGTTHSSTDTVEIRNMKFTPDSLVVKKGDTIVFVNRDIVDHCVTAIEGDTWTSGALPTGALFTIIASKSSGYYCAIHKVMKGTIIVQ